MSAPSTSRGAFLALMALLAACGRVEHEPPKPLPSASKFRAERCIHQPCELSIYELLANREKYYGKKVRFFAFAHPGGKRMQLAAHEDSIGRPEFAEAIMVNSWQRTKTSSLPRTAILRVQIEGVFCINRKFAGTLHNATLRSYWPSGPLPAEDELGLYVPEEDRVPRE